MNPWTHTIVLKEQLYGSKGIKTRRCRLTATQIVIEIPGNNRAVQRFRRRDGRKCNPDPWELWHAEINTLTPIEASKETP